MLILEKDIEVHNFVKIVSLGRENLLKNRKQKYVLNYVEHKLVI